MSPTYNHTRADGPFDPCPICAALQSPAERQALENDRRAVEADRVQESIARELLHTPTFVPASHGVPIRPLVDGSMLSDAEIRQWWSKMKRDPPMLPIYMEARPFRVVFDDDGTPSVDVEHSTEGFMLSDNDRGWKVLGQTDQTAVILEHSQNARFVGMPIGRRLGEFCEKNGIRLTATSRHLPPRQPIPPMTGPGFMAGVMVRDVA